MQTKATLPKTQDHWQIFDIDRRTGSLLQQRRELAFTENESLKSRLVCKVASAYPLRLIPLDI